MIVISSFDWNIYESFSDVGNGNVDKRNLPKKFKPEVLEVLEVGNLFWTRVAKWDKNTPQKGSNL